MRLTLTDAQKAHFIERFAEAMREVGILWLTFALLDRLVSGTLTFPWAIGNALGAIAAWAGGLYIELWRAK
jgi:hypothetical protein